MLSYQSEAEKNFYKGIFVTTSFELGEFAGGNPLTSSKDFPISINRDSRLRELLDNFMLDLNIELRQQIPFKGKISILQNYLVNAKEYRESQSIDFAKCRREWKYIANQNLGFMNLLIKELENKKVQLLTIGSNDSKSNSIVHFIIKDKKQKTEKQILELHRRLKKGKLIEGTATQFKAVFNLVDFDKPVIWVSGKANELLYFYYKLENTGIIEKAKNKYQILIHHFIKKNDLLFDENFKQIYQRIKNDYEQPLRAAEIDLCFNSIFTSQK